MSDDNLLAVYNASMDGASKYAYFLLAAAGSCIAFAITQTQTAGLAWNQIPLGAALVAWSISLTYGKLRLDYVSAILYANLALIKVQNGTDALAGRNPEHMLIAATGIRSALNTNVARAQRYSRLQVSALIIGSILYVGWHIFGMYLRTK